MSRTTRRTDKGRYVSWLPQIRKYELDGGIRWGSRHKPDEKKLAWLKKNPDRIDDVDDWFFGLYSKNPSHWNRQYFTLPTRRAAKALEKKIVKGEVDPDEVVWPHKKKPVTYYW